MHKGSRVCPKQQHILHLTAKDEAMSRTTIGCAVLFCVICVGMWLSADARACSSGNYCPTNYGCRNYDGCTGKTEDRCYGVKVTKIADAWFCYTIPNGPNTCNYTGDPFSCTVTKKCKWDYNQCWGGGVEVTPRIGRTVDCSTP